MNVCFSLVLSTPLSFTASYGVRAEIANSQRAFHSNKVTRGTVVGNRYEGHCFIPLPILKKISQTVTEKRLALRLGKLESYFDSFTSVIVSLF